MPPPTNQPLMACLLQYRYTLRNRVILPNQIVAAAAMFTVGIVAPVTAQNVIYHDGIPTSSYPMTTYPTNSYPIVYPSDGYVVGIPVQQPVVVSESSPVMLPTPTIKRTQTPSTPTVSHPSKTAPSKPATQLASARRGPRSSRLFDRRQNDQIDPLLPAWRYEPRLIRSARQTASQFRKIAGTSNQIVSVVASVNAELADQWAVLGESINAIASRVDDAETQLAITRRDYDDVNAKLDRYGLTPTIGLLLRDRKQQVEQWQIHDSDTLAANEQLQLLRQQQLELELVDHDGTDPIAQADKILRTAGYDPASIDNTALLRELRQLLRERSYWIGSLERGFQDYRDKFNQLDTAHTASATLTNDFRRLIDDHITWIRSDDPISGRDFRSLDDALGAFFGSDRSGDFGYTLQRKWGGNPISGIGLLISLFLMSIVRWVSKSWLVGIGSRKRMKDTPADLRKAAASLLTPVVAFVFPSMLYLLAQWLESGVVSESTLHASAACYAASLVALLVEVPRQLLRSHGYIDKHVEIELPRRSRATAYLTLIGFGLVLAAYVITLMGLIDLGMWRGSLSRFAFMAVMLLAAWTFHLALKLSGGFLEPLIAKFGGRVIYRVRLLIYLVGIGFPLAMLVLSALGYGFTASVLIKRAIITLAGGLIAAIIWPGIKILSGRAWLLLTGVKPPQRQFDEYGEVPNSDAPHVGGVLAEHSLELKHQLAFLCQCALVIAAVMGLGWLWIDVFPNVQMGNPVVWTVEQQAAVTTFDAAGQAIEETIVESKPITAMHLLLAAITMFVAFQLSKLLPAMWDALVLQRVSFDEGMEHLTLVLGRVLLFGVGCLIACNLLGVRWQTIQWLAVGLTIGIGFGLQDMVRNLFGGMVVLFEKPARLGDLITVGKVKGRVAAQRFRTTVLSDEEGREVIVPNKKFVSEDVVNWMGAGRLNVVPIEVAVNRDERPADICRSLYELALEQPDVLLSPPPQATLVCVSKKSQRIEVRLWIESDRNVANYRDDFLRTAKKYLRDRDLLVSKQPDQPAIPDLAREPTRSNRRRSA